VTPPATAYAAVAAMAEAAGAQVVRSEIVGLVPAAALAGVDPAELKLEAFSPDLLLEERLAQALRDRPGPERPGPDRPGRPAGVPRTPPAGVRR